MTETVLRVAGLRILKVFLNIFQSKINIEGEMRWQKL